MNRRTDVSLSSSKPSRAGYTVDQFYELTKIDRWFPGEVDEHHGYQQGTALFIADGELPMIPMWTCCTENNYKASLISRWPCPRLGTSNGRQKESHHLPSCNFRKSAGILPVVKQTNTLANIPRRPTISTTYSSTANDVSTLPRRPPVHCRDGLRRLHRFFPVSSTGAACDHGFHPPPEGHRSVMTKLQPETVSTDY